MVLFLVSDDARDKTKISILDGSLLTVRTCELPVVWSYVHYNKVSL